MLEVKNLRCSYDNTEVLRGVDFRVIDGEVVAVIGSSGSGKTTLLRCLSFLNEASSGTIKFDDFEKDITKLKKSEIRQLRTKMGYVFQDFNLFRNMTVKQNIMEGLTTARKVPREQAEKIAEEMMDKVGMSYRAHYYPDQLSGGQQQRAAIARSLAYGPEIILFDEPTSALDPELTREVLDVMRKLAKEGTTMVVVTHEMSFAQDVANRVVFMENGVVVEEGAADDFFTHPQKDATRRFLSISLQDVEYYI
ncbi:MAG: amino acid ABC transporter ATP-binding protein [Blautia sp.]|nr:amino acid ABC transporter ATP-binding protein [Blautia sp.]